jgi:hypothetical protein
MEFENGNVNICANKDVSVTMTVTPTSQKEIAQQNHSQWQEAKINFKKQQLTNLS